MSNRYPISTGYVFFIFFLLCGFPVLHAQQNKSYCKPSVIGVPRPKGLILKYELIPEFRISSDGRNGYSDADAEVKKNTRQEFKLRFPVINKPSLKLAAGINYSAEEYYFRELSDQDYSVYKALEDRDLKTAGIHFYVIKPTLTDRYFLLRISADLNGDFTNKEIPLGDFLKFSISPLIGWKKSNNLSYAVGFAYGYIFGRPSFYPLISYNRNISRYWGVESLLPANIKLRYSKCDKTFWYLSTEIKGASYRLSQEIPGLGGISKPHLHRSELRTGFSLEKQVAGWFWLGAETGLRNNISFNITNSPRTNSDVLIKNRLRTAPFISFSLFLVPPGKFINGD